MSMKAVREPTHWCSFCATPDTKVQTMIAGPAVNICDECVRLCVTIVAEKAVAREAARAAKAAEASPDA